MLRCCSLNVVQCPMDLTISTSCGARTQHFSPFSWKVEIFPLLHLYYLLFTHTEYRRSLCVRGYFITSILHYNHLLLAMTTQHFSIYTSLGTIKLLRARWHLFCELYYYYYCYWTLYYPGCTAAVTHHSGKWSQMHFCTSLLSPRHQPPAEVTGYNGGKIRSVRQKPPTIIANVWQLK